LRKWNAAPPKRKGGRNGKPKRTKCSYETTLPDPPNLAEAIFMQVAAKIGLPGTDLSKAGGEIILIQIQSSAYDLNFDRSIKAENRQNSRFKRSKVFSRQNRRGKNLGGLQSKKLPKSLPKTGVKSKARKPRIKKRNLCDLQILTRRIPY
jgi:hypothetical protein